VRVLSPNEKALLDGNHDFTRVKQRYIRYRLKKKLRLLDESRDAAAAQLLRLEGEDSLVRIPQPTGGLSLENFNDYEVIDKKVSGPGEIRTPDPRHVKAVS
jgi:hypothetical protein